MQVEHAMSRDISLGTKRAILEKTLQFTVSQVEIQSFSEFLEAAKEFSVFFRLNPRSFRKLFNNLSSDGGP